MIRARALWFEKAGSAVLREERLADVKKGWCLVETLFSAISPGTERLVFSGKVPPALHKIMALRYMQGSFSFPVKYGYSLVGRIIDGPEDRTGQIVHLLHPHQDRCVVRLEDAFPVPLQIPAPRASLASNCETALNALWDSKVLLGDRVLVVGFGVIGSLVSRLVSFMMETEVVVTDILPEKISLARKLGFQACCPGDLDQNFDIAFHASGTSEGLQLAIDGVGLEGKIVELSWFGTDSVSLSLGEGFHAQRKKILSSQVSRISASRTARWDLKRRKSLVFRLLKHQEFDEHITHSFSFDRLPEIFERHKDKPFSGLGYLIKY